MWYVNNIGIGAMYRHCDKIVWNDFERTECGP
jgi:hypothetical protein